MYRVIQTMLKGRYRAEAHGHVFRGETVQEVFDKVDEYEDRLQIPLNKSASYMVVDELVEGGHASA